MSFVCCYICHHRLRSSGDLYRDDSSTGSSYHSRLASNGSSKSSAGQCRRRQRACYVSRRERFVGTTSTPRTSNSAAFMCLAVVVLALLGTHGVSGFSCHKGCSCIWRSGKQTATCTNLSLTKVPTDLDSGVQVLDLKSNQIPYLPRQAFVDARLTNLQKLYLAECGLSQIDETAFIRLTNLIELDLSQNYLTMVPSPSFRHLTILRTLTLEGNKITFLGQQAFSDLKHLITLDISSCMIDSVAMGAFDGLEKLEKLVIDGNRLGSLSGKAVLPLKSLNEIHLDNNPWRCDCDLRALRHWLYLRNIPYVPPTCDKPPRLTGKSWSQMTPEEFACPPAFLNTSSAFQVYEGSNVTLECKTTGDPLPTISWYWRDRVLGNLSEGISPRQIFTVVERSEREKYSALTVSYVQEANNGPYTCKAENVAAKVAKNFTVHVSRKPVTEVKVTGSGGSPGGSNQDDNPQEVRELDAGGVSGADNNDGSKDTLIGLIVGVVGGALLVLIIFAVVLLVCRRRRRDRRQRAEASAAGGPLNKLAPMDKVPDCIDEADTKLLSPRPQNVSVLPPAYLHQHEMEPLEPLMERNSLSPHVWVVKDHVPPEWAPRRSPIPVPMPVAPNSNDPEANARLHNELADTLRRKGDRRVINERERGDGSSEMEAAEDPDGLKIPPGHYGTLRARDLQDRSSGDEPDLLLLERPKRTQILPSVMEHPHPQYQPSTLDRRHASPAPGHARQDWGDAYDHPSAYFRPVQSAPVANPILHVPVLQTVKDADDGGGSDGTEV